MHSSNQIHIVSFFLFVQKSRFRTSSLSFRLRSWLILRFLISAVASFNFGNFWFVSITSCSVLKETSNGLFISSSVFRPSQIVFTYCVSSMSILDDNFSIIFFLDFCLYSLSVAALSWDF